MTAIAPVFSSPTISFQKKEKLSFVELGKRIYSRFSEHTDLLNSFGYLLLNTSMVASRIFNSIPRVVGNGIYAVFGYFGVLSVGYQWKAITKSVQDCAIAFHLQDYPGLVTTALRVAVQGIDMLLCYGLFAAALLSLGGYSVQALFFYGFMRPIGLASFFAGIGLEIQSYFVNDAVIERIQKYIREHICSEGIEQIDKIIKTNRVDNHVSKEDAFLFMRLLRQLDERMIEMLKEKAAKKYEPLLEGLKSKQDWTRNNLVLTVLGYVAIGIGRAFPNTLIQSTANWYMSLLYTSKLIQEKYDREVFRDLI